MPDRAKIEAVARALYHDEGGTKDGEIHWRYYQTAEKVIEALDRVHDARDDTTTNETPAGRDGYTLAALGTPPPDDDTDT